MECSGILNGYTIWYAMGCNGIQSPEVTLGWCIAGLIINFGLWYFKRDYQSNHFIKISQSYVIGYMYVYVYIYKHIYIYIYIYKHIYI